MSDDKNATPEDGAVSKADLTDSVAVELIKGGLAQLEVESEAEPEVAAPREVKLTEEGWTAQSNHGVLLNHFVPTQNYAALDVPTEQTSDDANDGSDW